MASAPPSAGRSRGPTLPWRSRDTLCVYHFRGDIQDAPRPALLRVSCNPRHCEPVTDVVGAAIRHARLCAPTRAALFGKRKALSPLDKTNICAIINMKRRCDKRLALELGYFKMKKPSLARVAVSAFHNDRYGKPSDM